MRLCLQVADGTLFDGPVAKVLAEAENGQFCLKPRHVDLVTSLAPGLLSCTLDGGGERVFAVDRGILVKCGERVSVAARRAVAGPDLERLRDTVRADYHALGEREERSRSALARLTARFLHSCLESTGRSGG